MVIVVLQNRYGDLFENHYRTEAYVNFLRRHYWGMKKNKTLNLRIIEASLTFIPSDYWLSQIEYWQRRCKEMYKKFR